MNIAKVLKKQTLFLIIVFFIFFSKICTAQTQQCLSGQTYNPQTSSCVQSSSATSSSTPTSYTTLENPISKSGEAFTASVLFQRIIKFLLGLVGSLSLVTFIYGGILWLTSSGNSDQIKKGKDVFLYSVIGLVVVFGSYAILNFVITAFIN